MNIEIRAWEKTDIDLLAGLANNPYISSKLRDGFPFPYTKKDAEEWVGMIAVMVPPTQFAVIADGQLVGAIGFIIKENVYRKNVEIGYWIGEPFWNQGIASEAIRLLVDHIFLHFDIVRVYAEVFSNNPASMKALEKNGFHLEAIHHKSIIKNDKLLDDYCWVKLREGI
ncbi:MAG: GNAT family N-acetyltransferase [Bacteroidetes bacterium]|jgi:[ribosomal protein S5]-alanine N-acetyltransferase|nr:GNAT family N-acetyltransferase [Bacteroidota bacterium]